jgi:hypothetical protein
MWKCLCNIGLLMVSLISFQTTIEAGHDPKHLEDVRALLAQTANGNTSYLSGAIQVTWKGYHGAKASTCFTDSSGLLDALFNHSYGFNSTYFLQWLGTARPLAQDYYQAILTGNRFLPIANLADVRPGDILSIKFNDVSGIDLGYVAIVDKQPTFMNQKHPFVEGAQQWAVYVIDCATTGHGTKDTRHLGSGAYSSGLGRGTIRFYIDMNGRIVAYTWSRHEGSPCFLSSVRPVAIGRLIH